jgi:hypothetical protein
MRGTNLHVAAQTCRALRAPREIAMTRVEVGLQAQHDTSVRRVRTRRHSRRLLPHSLTPLITPSLPHSRPPLLALFFGSAPSAAISLIRLVR